MSKFTKARICGETLVSHLKSAYGEEYGIMDRAVTAGSASMEAMRGFLSRMQATMTEGDINPLSFIADTCCGIGADAVNRDKQKHSSMRVR